MIRKAAAALLCIVPVTTAAASEPAPANAMIQLRRDGVASRPFALLDLSDAAAVKGSKPSSRALEAFLRSLDPGKELPKGSLVIRGDALLVRLDLDGGAAEAYADLRPSAEGGMIRARYRASGRNFAGRSKSYLVARVLYNLGFSVALDDDAVTGLADVDHQALAPERMAESLALFLRAVQGLGAFERSLPKLLEGAPGQAETSRRLDALARTFVAEEAPSLASAARTTAAADAAVAGESVGAPDSAAFVARVSYDKARASREGLVFVTPYAEDVTGFGKLRAVVFTAGGGGSLTALAARRAEIPAIFVASAEWTPSRGAKFGSGAAAVLLREGASVRIDPKTGELVVLASR
ncbi:MAG: hypothetical protein HY078_16800 [Elusimicrobia bacterium]|nr:hypothetical protein [Elusimicrobiota bacterium]